MDDKTRLQLQKMIDANDVQDQTSLIRKLKHSDLIIRDIRVLQQLKTKYKADDPILQEKGVEQCSFLFENYTDIFNRVKKDEIDLSLLNQFLNVLQQIENGSLDQHEASYMVGTILKEIYIDSALKKGEKLDKEHAKEDVPKLEPKVNVSWKEYKMQNSSS